MLGKNVERRESRHHAVMDAKRKPLKCANETDYTPGTEKALMLEGEITRLAPGSRGAPVLRRLRCRPIESPGRDTVRRRAVRSAGPRHRPTAVLPPTASSVATAASTFESPSMTHGARSREVLGAIE